MFGNAELVNESRIRMFIRDCRKHTYLKFIASEVGTALGKNWRKNVLRSKMKRSIGSKFKNNNKMSCKLTNRLRIQANWEIKLHTTYFVLKM